MQGSNAERHAVKRMCHCATAALATDRQLIRLLLPDRLLINIHYIIVIRHER